MKNRDFVPRVALLLLVALFMAVGARRAASQPPEIARKQYQEMRRNYALALEALDRIDGHLKSKKYEPAVTSLEEVVALKTKLDKADLPNTVKRSVSQWDQRIRGYAKRLREAGVKLPASLVPPKKKAAPGRDPKIALQGEHRVTITCDQPALVAGQRLYIIKHVPRKHPKGVPPAHRMAELYLLETDSTFDEDGQCTVELDDDGYRFETLFEKEDRVVVLSSGMIEVKSHLDVQLKTQAPQPVHLTKRGKQIEISEALFRVRGWRTMDRRGFWKIEDIPRTKPMPPHMTLLKWKRKDASLEVILSPGHRGLARLSAIQQDGPQTTHTVVWEELNADDPVVDLDKRELTTVKFAYLGTPRERQHITKTKVTFFFPEQDELTCPLSPDVALVTNRRLIETRYEFETAAGEYFSFNRRAHVLKDPRYTIRWGGTLKASAFAAVAYTWKKKSHFVWGAYLYNEAHDVVNTHDRWGEPSFSATPQAKIHWQETLRRIDGEGEVPKDVRHHKKRWAIDPGYAKKSMGATLWFKKDQPRFAKMFQVECSYQMFGELHKHTAACVPFDHWTSKQFTMLAPEQWKSRGAVYLMKSERIMDLCKYTQKRDPKVVSLRWCGLGWAGYTIGSRSEMGFYGLREYQNIYSIIGLYVHEMLHAYGHGHGGEHNRWIKELEDEFMQFKQHLADHPEYLPPAFEIAPLEQANNS